MERNGALPPFRAVEPPKKLTKEPPAPLSTKPLNSAAAEALKKFGEKLRTNAADSAADIAPKKRGKNGVPNLDLTARDLTILWYAWQQRFVAVRQFQRLFWPKGANVTARNRLNELRDAGLLGSETFPVGADRTLYFSSKAGNQALVDAGMLIEAFGATIPAGLRKMPSISTTT